MKHIISLSLIACLLIGCNSNEPSYRDGKNIEVAGRVFAEPTDTFIFHTDGTFERKAPLFPGFRNGTYIQSYEVVRLHWISSEYHDDYIFISYGDFLMCELGVYQEIK